MRPRALLFAAAVAALGAAACTVTTDPGVTTVDPTLPPSASGGTLRVDWTINGSTDPNACTQSAATTLEFSVITAQGTPPAIYQQSCGTFATSIPLSPGSYSGTAVLLDAAQNPRTTTIEVQPFTIRANEELRIPIDFPSSSFF